MVKKSPSNSEFQLKAYQTIKFRLFSDVPATKPPVFDASSLKFRNCRSKTGADSGYRVGMKWNTYKKLSTGTDLIDQKLIKDFIEEPFRMVLMPEEGTLFYHIKTPLQ